MRVSRITGQTLNILRVFHLATANELQAGLSWYRDAGDIALRRMRAVNRKHKCGYKITRRTAAGVIAALSPQKAWGVNLDMADQMVRTGDCGTYKKQVAKATMILGGIDPGEVLVGPKERAFYENLISPDSSLHVTVDGHAYNIWMGEFQSTVKTKVTKILYGLAAKDYRSASALLGLAPHQVQAITWLAWRRIHNSRGHVIDANKSLRD